MCGYDPKVLLTQYDHFTHISSKCQYVPTAPEKSATSIKLYMTSSYMTSRSDSTLKWPSLTLDVTPWEGELALGLRCDQPAVRPECLYTNPAGFCQAVAGADVLREVRL